jgi:hypothetical protein
MAKNIFFSAITSRFLRWFALNGVPMFKVFLGVKWILKPLISKILYTGQTNTAYMTNTTSPQSRSEGRDVYETVKDNFLRTIDEIAKVQPQFSQSISNLQIDYIQTTKNLIQNVASTQRQFSSGLNVPGTGQYSEQLAKQSTELTNNTIRAVGINNQLAINALDAARENLKIYNRTIDAVTDFSTNIAKTWESFFSVQQQNFFAK